MICNKCGTVIPDELRICPKCGYNLMGQRASTQGMGGIGPGRQRKNASAKADGMGPGRQRKNASAKADGIGPGRQRKNIAFVAGRVAQDWDSFELQSHAAVVSKKWRRSLVVAFIGIAIIFIAVCAVLVSHPLLTDSIAEIDFVSNAPKEPIYKSEIAVYLTPEKENYENGEDIVLNAKVENFTPFSYVSMNINPTGQDDLYVVVKPPAADEVDFKYGDTAAFSMILNTNQRFLERYPFALLVAGFFVLIVAAAIAVASHLRRKKKSRNQIVPVILCAVLAIGLLNPIRAYAQPTGEENSIFAETSCNVTVDGKEYTFLLNVTVHPDFADPDNDGVPNYVEAFFGSDPNEADSDDDGLNDYQEIYILSTDPLKKDSDGNATTDYDEDFDGDSLSNGEEFEFGSDPLDADADNDGLSDFDEKAKGSDPHERDSDGDGADDGWEVENGFDPLVANSEFAAEASLQATNVSIRVETSASGTQAETLAVTASADGILTDDMPGYIGEAFDVAIDGSINAAKISFTFDEELLNNPDFEPAIYCYDDDMQLLNEIETIVSGNEATATITHFSKYILLNKIAFDEAWSTQIRIPATDSAVMDISLDVVLAIDSSGSMSSNDPNYLRKDAAAAVVNKMTDQDRSAVVDFDSSAVTLIGFSNDKTAVIDAMGGIDAAGGTSLTSGIKAGLNLFGSETYDGTNKSKYIIMLTDGIGTYDNRLTEDAKASHVVIYTIGLSDAVDENLLRSIAAGTGGLYFRATEAGELAEIFENTINEAIDFKTDTNNDGISDYFLKLLCDGTLKTGTGVGILEGADYETLRNNADWDGDNLANGEELEITVQQISETENKVYVKMKSNPLLYDTDGDSYGDYEEVKIHGTNPNTYNTLMLSGSVSALANDSLYTSANYVNTYETSAKESINVWIQTAIFGGRWDQKTVISEYLKEYLKTIVEGTTAEDTALMTGQVIISMTQTIETVVNMGVAKYTDECLDLIKATHQPGGFARWGNMANMKIAQNTLQNMKSSPSLQKTVNNVLDVNVHKMGKKFFANLKAGAATAGYVLDLVDIAVSTAESIMSLIEDERNLAEYQKMIDVLKLVQYGTQNDGLRDAAKDLIDAFQNEWTLANQNVDQAFQKIVVEKGVPIALGVTATVYNPPIAVGLAAVLVGAGISNLVFKTDQDGFAKTKLYTLGVAGIALSAELAKRYASMQTVDIAAKDYVAVYGEENALAAIKRYSQLHTARVMGEDAAIEYDSHSPFRNDDKIRHAAIRDTLLAFDMQNPIYGSSYILPDDVGVPNNLA